MYFFSILFGFQVIYELPTSHQWSFDVQWCPRNPAIISSCAFDGHISIYSLMGGEIPVEPMNQITDSFGSMDPFEQAQAQQKMLQQQQQQAAQKIVMPLQKPPRWFRRPVGASFGVSFSSVGIFVTSQNYSSFLYFTSILWNLAKLILKRCKHVFLQFNQYNRLDVIHWRWKNHF
jgi:WD40 repeat protein